MADSNSNTIQPYMLTDIIDKDIFDLVTRSIGHGSFGAGTFNVINGINLMPGKPTLPPVSDRQPMVFWTKPDCNLSHDNVKNSRRLAWLEDSEDNSMANAIRCTLSPPGRTPPPGPNEKNVRSNLIDDKLVFIPLLTNTCLTLSGWPEIVANSYTTEVGIGGEQMVMLDGRPDFLGQFDLSASFQNFEGDPLLPLIAAWVEYGQQVSQGTVDPYVENVIERRIDYNSRIFSIVLDATGKYVQHIVSTICIPTNVPYGTIFDFSSGDIFNDAGNTINLVFKCVGAPYDDPILAGEFNKTVAMLMPEIETKSGLVKVDGALKSTDQTETWLAKPMLNYKAYPYINLDTLEFEWWTTQAELDKATGIVNKFAKQVQNAGAPAPANKVTRSPWALSVMALNADAKTPPNQNATGNTSSSNNSSNSPTTTIA